MINYFIIKLSYDLQDTKLENIDTKQYSSVSYMDLFLISSFEQIYNRS